MSAESAIIPRFMEIIKEEKNFLLLLLWYRAEEGSLSLAI
jgi:hypothetical protein